MRISKPVTQIIAALILLSAQTVCAVAGEVTVAVASNFLGTVQKIAKQFQMDTGHTVNLVNGSTGTLFAQIIRGAPYDLFLSADRHRVLLLNDAGKLLDGAHKPYALGKLVLFARDIDKLSGNIENSLKADDIRHFSMADSTTAPYGLAADQVLAALNLSGLIKQKAVIGTNIGQTFNFIATGNAELGFVALSQANQTDGKWIGISEELYDPIVQEVGLLGRSADNEVAKEFYDYLTSDTADALIISAGYGVPD